MNLQTAMETADELTINGNGDEPFGQVVLILAAAVRRGERWRDHSMLLNTLGWRIARALGEIEEGQQRMQMDISEAVNRLIVMAGLEVPDEQPG